MHVSLTITQCRCVTCNHSWVTSTSVRMIDDGSSVGAAIDNDRTPNTQISYIWDREITYHRCFRCITPEDLQTKLNKLPDSVPPARPQQGQQTSVAIDLEELDKLGE